MPPNQVKTIERLNPLLWEYRWDVLPSGNLPREATGSLGDKRKGGRRGVGGGGRGGGAGGMAVEIPGFRESCLQVMFNTAWIPHSIQSNCFPHSHLYNYNLASPFTFRVGGFLILANFRQISHCFMRNTLCNTSISVSLMFLKLCLNFSWMIGYFLSFTTWK